MTNKNAFDLDHPALSEARKAQEIVFEAIDKTARQNLDATQKLLELNKKRYAETQDMSSPSDYLARQSAATKDYAEQVNAHLESLAAIGNESREQLTEIGQEFARNMDFSGMFPFAPQAATKTKTKPASKSS